jgi:hypothetical protein
LAQTFNPAMRNCNAAPNARRTEALALQQRFENLAGVELGQLRCLFGQLLQGLLLIFRRERGDDTLRR